ncbi:MAG: HEAT repeat domain-containing protein, partial [Planctomycetaceae bacterium]|nr:HEAT repeat domain-containing protein [Planctomycetaceae bacterium]
TAALLLPLAIAACASAPPSPAGAGVTAPAPDRAPASDPAPLPPTEGEAVYDGLPLDHWLREMHDLHPDRRKAACEAVRTFGERALPGILRACASEFPRVRVDALQTLGYLTYDRLPDPAIVDFLVAATGDPDEDVRVQAAEVLRYQDPLPPAARAALEALRDADPNPWVRTSAANFLRALAEEEGKAREGGP